MFFKIIYLTLLISTFLAIQGVNAARSGGRYGGRGSHAPPGGSQYDLICPDDKPDKQSGLCYKKCKEGYHGVGPLCWKGSESYGRGVGISPLFNYMN
jgi:uncharacterized membrane protein